MKPHNHKRFWILFLAMIFFVAGMGPAHAYLDPGTAGMLLQLLLGCGVAGAAVILKLYWQRIKSKLFGSAPPAPTDDKRKD